MSRFLRGLGIAFLLAIGARPSVATVVVDHVFVGPAQFTFGDTIQIDVRLSWDGQGALLGIQSSTSYDASVLEFVSSTPAPSLILAFVDDSDPEGPVVIPGLQRLANAAITGGALRSVQYGAFFPADSRAATTGAGLRITTLTFRIIGAGQTDVSTFLASGDTGATGDRFVAGSSVCVWSDGLCAPVVPEPGTATLIGLGLTALTLRARRVPA